MGVLAVAGVMECMEDEREGPNVRSVRVVVQRSKRWWTLDVKVEVKGVEVELRRLSHHLLP